MAKPQDNSTHAFEHCGNIFVLDFNKMRCWTIDPAETPRDAIVAIDLERKFPQQWLYRPVGGEGEFVQDFDEEWTEKVENRYHDYAKQMVVSRQRTRKVRR